MSLDRSLELREVFLPDRDIGLLEDAPMAQLACAQFFLRLPQLLGKMQV